MTYSQVSCIFSEGVRVVSLSPSSSSLGSYSVLDYPHALRWVSEDPFNVVSWLSHHVYMSPLTSLCHHISSILHSLLLFSPIRSKNAL